MGVLFHYFAFYSIFMLMVSLGILVLYIVAMWKLFEKAGIEGYKSLIPIYNAYVMNEIVFGNGWFFLIGLIPFVNGVYYIALSFCTAKAYGQSNLYGLGMIFFSPILSVIMAFGDADYEGPIDIVGMLRN